MNINEIIWLDAIIEKLASKHGVDIDEVEEVFNNKPQFRFIEKGTRVGEDVYMASGQTDGGRYLTVLFIAFRTWFAAEPTELGVNQPR